MTPSLPVVSRITVILFGAAIPALAFGRVVFAAFVGLAFISLFFCKSWRQIARDLWAQCQGPVGILVLLTFVAWLPNVGISNFPVRSFEAVARTLAFVGIAAVFLTYLRSAPQLLKTCLQAFIVSALIAAGFALISMTVLPEIYWALRLKGWLAVPLENEQKGFAALAVMIVPVVLLGGYRIGRVWKMLGVLASISFLALVWETYNRAAIAGFLAIVIAVTVSLVARRGSKTQALVALGGIGSLVAGTVFWLWSSRGHTLKLAPAHDWLLPVWLLDFERQTIWASAWKFGSVSPWFGIGANAINFVPGADALLEGTSGLHVIPSHPHNWFVEVFAETGGIGLAALVVTLVVFGLQLLKNYRQSGSLATLTAIAIMAGYWGSGLFNFSYWSAWWQLSFAVSLALALACVDRAQLSDDEK